MSLFLRYPRAGELGPFAVGSQCRAFTHRGAAHIEAIRVVNYAVEMPSAAVGSPICSCQRVTGSCDVRMVERV